MTSSEIIRSIVLTFITCLICGVSYAFAASDSKPRKRKTIAVAVGSGLVGWLFAMALPIQEYKSFAAIVVAGMASVYGSHIYWFIFKEKSKTTKTIDANGHGRHTHASRKSAFNSI